MTDNKSGQAIHLLAAINRLGLKAFTSPSKTALIFLILNDTIQVVRYNRASLWKIDAKEMDLLGVSGHASVNSNSFLASEWSQILRGIKNNSQPQILESVSQIKEHDDIPGLKNIVHENVAFVWIPFYSKEGTVGLLLERWNGVKWQYDEVEIMNFLAQNYSAAWSKFARSDRFKQLFNKPVRVAAVICAISLLFVQIPLRIVAPCEIVAKNPMLITAPLEGIIEEVKVEPGQSVKKGDLLFSYDKKIPLEELKVAQRQLNVAEADAKRANSLAFREKKALGEYAILALKLKKERTLYDLARYKASQLNVYAPEDGIVMLKNKDEWRGNPTQIGEKIMMIGDPNDTEVKIWIPESDNINLDLGADVKVILNAEPGSSYKAKLSYIAPYISFNEKNMPSFVAEADWQAPPSEVKIGLKGTAILYSENVSLFYYIIRHPLTYIRTLLGL
ncbi:MAG: efflux RND transporter periplasmic adaptor subunit [Parachlamydiaceae bacterium]